MTRKKYFVMTFMILLFFIFIKIYQHNLLIKLNYEKQRFEKKNSKLRKKKNELLVQYFKLKNQHRVKNVAQQDLGMQPIKLSQVITFTQNG